MEGELPPTQNDTLKFVAADYLGWQMDIRLIPMLALLYLLSFLDRELTTPLAQTFRPADDVSRPAQVATLAMPKLKASRRI